MTEVGVSLALRRKKKLLHSEAEGRMKKREKPASTKSKRKIIDDKKRPSNSSWQIFVEGAALYALCLVLPSILGAILRVWRRCWEKDGMFHQVAVLPCSFPWVSSFQWCLQQTAKSGPESVSSNSSLTDALAPDAGFSDVAIVVLLSLTMAVVRLTLVHFLVPNYNQPRRLEALVRCKSISLLSSSYPGTVTPRSSIKSKSVSQRDMDTIPAMPSLETNDNETVKPRQLFGSSTIRSDLINDWGGPNDDQGHDNSEYDVGGETWIALDDPDEDNEEDNDLTTAPAVSSGLISSSSALSLQALLHQATPGAPKTGRESIMKDEPDRIFAAPKYATAVFRMIFCSVSCMIALLYFLDADFWPPAVGGSGSTKNCWDLSSVGAAVMDPDFDQHNTFLRRYYLVQASYHFHSGAFHVLAAMLLWLVSSSSRKEEKARPKFLGFIPAGMMTIQNVQSLFQHCFAVGIIAFTYLFSSLRRLGVIAMFAFDFSSWFLHLLQMCINAPYGSRRISARRIQILHRGLVIPAFCYSRFYIFPFVVGYSSLEESQDWLRQLENMFVPGTARYIHGVFVVSFCLFMILNFVYARRLLYHAHVKDALNRPK